MKVALKAEKEDWSDYFVFVNNVLQGNDIVVRGNEKSICQLGYVPYFDVVKGHIKVVHNDNSAMTLSFESYVVSCYVDLYLIQQDILFI